MTETTDEAHPNYYTIRLLGGTGATFTAIYEGQRRAFRVMEHVNEGKGWLLLPIGRLTSIIAESQVTDIEASND